MYYRPEVVFGINLCRDGRIRGSMEKKDVAMKYGEEAFGLRREIEAGIVAKEWINLIEKTRRGEK